VIRAGLLAIAITACSSSGPHIATVSPTSVAQGSMITITGSGLCGSSDDCGSAEVDIQIGTVAPYFEATPQTVSADQIQALLPADITTGTTQLAVTVNGQSSNGVQITIVAEGI
jgi:uncharacterized protein (TIGR03437 family)